MTQLKWKMYSLQRLTFLDCKETGQANNIISTLCRDLQGMHLPAFTHVDFIELGISRSSANRFRIRARVHHLAGPLWYPCKVTEDSLSNSLNTFF